MKLKRFFKKCVAMLSIMAISMTTSLTVFAMEPNTTVHQEAINESDTIVYAADDGWSGGGFFNNNGSYHTGAKYFSAGNIYISLKSTNQTSSSTFYRVWLRNYATGETTTKLSVLANGTSTANFINMPAGSYQLYMTKDDNSSYQAYEVLGYGSR